MFRVYCVLSLHHAIQVLPAGQVLLLLLLLLLLLFRLLTPASSCPPPPLPLSTFAEIHPTPAVSGDFCIDPDVHASDLIAGTSDAEDLRNLVTYYTGDCSTENFAVDAITLAQQVAMSSIQVLLPVLHGVSGGSVRRGYEGSWAIGCRGAYRPKLSIAPICRAGPAGDRVLVCFLCRYWMLWYTLCVCAGY